MSLVAGHVSHLDHGLDIEILFYILKKFRNKRGFFIETFKLPSKFGTIGCGLYGPVMGDPPVPLDEVRMVQRPGRNGPTPMVDRPPRPTHILTVIAGPEAEFDTYLFTAFGGPLAPREPHDSDIESPEELAASKEFWSLHALSL